MPRAQVVIELASDARFARDLAAGGVFVPGCALPLAEECDLLVCGANREITLPARVVYVDAYRGAGLELLGFSPELKAELATLEPVGRPEVEVVDEPVVFDAGFDRGGLDELAADDDLAYAPAESVAVIDLDALVDAAGDDLAIPIGEPGRAPTGELRVDRAATALEPAEPGDDDDDAGATIAFDASAMARTATTKDYAGYGDWKGDSGTINPPDSTISQTGGSGADRLRVNSDQAGDWRVKVSVTPLDPATFGNPSTPAALDLSQHTDSTLTVQFKIPDGPQAGAYRIRYSDAGPITEQNFLNANPAPSPKVDAAGAMVSAQIQGLRPKTHYYVAVRPESRCGELGSLVTAEVDTSTANFATLSGCFIATAAYGAEWEPEVAMLRGFRDRYLLDNALGQVAVASYYTLSPPFAGLIAQHEPLRQLAQQALSPVVRAVKATTTTLRR